jgi:hypothetical protein
MATVTANRNTTGFDSLTGRLMRVAPIVHTPVAQPQNTVVPPSPVVRSSLRFTTRTIQMRDLIKDFEDKTIDVPDHQRDFVWGLKKQQGLINTLQRGLPIPTVLLGSRLGEKKLWIEDGRQRLTTVQMFMNNEFPNFEGKKWDDLTKEEQFNITHYSVPVTEYSGATDEERIDIFDRFQNGSPLTNGERLHALTACSSVVKFAKKLLVRGSPLSDRLAVHWGDKVTNDNRKKFLENIVAAVLGIAFGPALISKKWEDIRDYLNKTLNEGAMMKDFTRVADIYDEVLTKEAGLNKTEKRRLFDCGSYLGYILYSLSYKRRMAQGGNVNNDVGYVPNSLEGDDAEWKRLKDGWVKFLVEARRDTDLMKDKLHYDCSFDMFSRTWQNKRWELGYLRVFDSKNPRIVEIKNGTDRVSDDGEDDE